jgi:hypothetical protein
MKDESNTFYKCTATFQTHCIIDMVDKFHLFVNIYKKVTPYILFANELKNRTV